MFDTARFEGVPKLFVSDVVERLHEVDCCSPHFDSPLVTSLINHPVRRQMVCCLVRASEPRLIFCLELVESGILSAVQYRRKQFVQRRQRTDRAVVSDIFNVTYFVYHFYSHFSPCLQCKFILPCLRSLGRLSTIPMSRVMTGGSKRYLTLARLSTTLIKVLTTHCILPRSSTALQHIAFRAASSRHIRNSCAIFLLPPAS